MVTVSNESADEIDRRLRSLMSSAELDVLPGAWSFFESSADRPPEITPQTLALVRDEHSWSALRPDVGRDDERERFGVFSFHFPDNADNSGFVGWLATQLKATLGTGVFVICGSNRRRGGIYDYWGCPIDLLDDVITVVNALRTDY